MSIKKTVLGVCLLTICLAAVVWFVQPSQIFAKSAQTSSAIGLVACSQDNYDVKITATKSRASTKVEEYCFAGEGILTSVDLYNIKNFCSRSVRGSFSAVSVVGYNFYSSYGPNKCFSSEGAGSATIAKLSRLEIIRLV